VPAEVFHRMCFHFAWATKRRLPVLEGERGAWIVRCIVADAGKRGAIIHACNAMPDHVHLLVSLPPTVPVPTFIGQVKGASAFAYNREWGTRHPLKWQKGYGVVTAVEGKMNGLIRYIADQERIHAARRTNDVLEQMGGDEDDDEDGANTSPGP